MPKQPKYSESSIYKLCCKDPTITGMYYVGSTTNFRQRKRQHKHSCTELNLTKSTTVPSISTFVTTATGTTGIWLRLREIQCEGQAWFGKKRTGTHREFACHIKSIRSNTDVSRVCHWQQRSPCAKTETVLWEEQGNHTCKTKEVWSEEQGENLCQEQNISFVCLMKNKDTLQVKKIEYYNNNKKKLAEKSKLYRANNRDILRQKKNEKIVCECHVVNVGWLTYLLLTQEVTEVATGRQTGTCDPSASCDCSALTNSSCWFVR